jgi:hypothetical protein
VGKYFFLSIGFWHARLFKEIFEIKSCDISTTYFPSESVLVSDLKKGKDATFAFDAFHPGTQLQHLI